jgi:DNA-binding transcriptional LysR family regulator
MDITFCNGRIDADPPLNPLHVFDVAARHLSFTRAAAELRVTQPAISRQITTLEGFLGVQAVRARSSMGCG